MNTHLVPHLFVALFLFIIASLIYDHYERGYYLTNYLFNQTIFVERALKRIPICNENDYLKHKSLLYTFQTWTQLAQSNQLRYWIAYKTLTAYVRYYGLAPYDHDIDVFIMAEDISKVVELMKANYSSMYKLKVSKDTDLNASINIWPVYTNRSLLVQYLDADSWISSPIEWTFPLEPCVFSGIQVWCPARPNKLVHSQISVVEFACIQGS